MKQSSLLWFYLILIIQLAHTDGIANISHYYKNTSDVLMAVCEQGHGQNYRVCGGTLIYNMWLLTSQSCRTNRHLDHLLIGVFETIYDRQRESSMKEHFLRKWITHQNYEFSQSIIRNDIALLRLEGRYYTYVRKEIMKLPTKELFDVSGIASNKSKHFCNFLFWPMETFNWSTHPRFIYSRSAMVQIIPRSTCRNIVTDIVIAREQFCGTFAEDEPVLEGLSSGPLLCFKIQFAIYTAKSFDPNGKLILIFTRLDYFQNYIEGITRISPYVDTFPEVEERAMEDSIDNINFNGVTHTFSRNVVLYFMIISFINKYF